jgi:DNA-binding LacI/PurR family transcriptional regulator
MSAAIIDDSVKNPSCEKPSQTYSLGILFMDESEKGLTHPFFASVLNGFKIAAEARGYEVTFREFEGRHEIPTDVLLEGLRWLRS